MIKNNIVKKLINIQFPEYANLKIIKIETQGHDNTTFLLDNNLILSFPNGPQYAKRISKYYLFLSKIQDSISIEIPSIIHLGNPSLLFPYHWTIGKWIEGKSTNLIIDTTDLNIFAHRLADILREFKNIYIDSAEMMPSQENWFRGAHVSAYESDVIKSLKILGNILDSEIILNIWNHAVSTKWQGPGIFVHGDIALGNIIYKDNTLHGLIDFGTMCIGDPACDLMIAYTVFNTESRAIFQDIIKYDKNTWIRGMGWTLWKALLELSQSAKSNAKDWENPKKTIDEIITDYKTNYIS